MREWEKKRERDLPKIMNILDIYSNVCQTNVWENNQVWKYMAENTRNIFYQNNDGFRMQEYNMTNPNSTQSMYVLLLTVYLTTRECDTVCLTTRVCDLVPLFLFNIFEYLFQTIGRFMSLIQTCFSCNKRGK